MGSCGAGTREHTTFNISLIMLEHLNLGFFLLHCVQDIVFLLLKYLKFLIAVLANCLVRWQSAIWPNTSPRLGLHLHMLRIQKKKPLWAKSIEVWSVRVENHLDDKFFLFISAEASCWRGTDAAAGPCREPDSHDAGHHGPEFVLLQRQTDDRESPSPAWTLKRPSCSSCGDDEWTNETWRKGSGGIRSGDAAESPTALFSPQSSSHSDTEILGSLTHAMNRASGAATESVFRTFCSQNLQGFVGAAHSG